MTFKPLLAPNKDPLSYKNYFKELRYPLLCSAKYDGIRCIIKNGVAISRSGKPLRSYQVQEEFSKYENFDGELIVGNPTDEGVYNRTQSHVMSFNKPANLRYYVFDYTSPTMLDKPFQERLSIIYNEEMSVQYQNFSAVSHVLVEDEAQLLAFEKYCLDAGFEGIMMRSPDAPYKQGRATFNEGIIYKLKRFQDDEGIIVGFKEAWENQNEQERSELGYAKRSSSKEGLVHSNTLGVFLVKFKGDIINVSCGSLSHEERKLIWENQKDFQGQMLKFRYFDYGVKDAPRVARALGFRDLGDM